STTSRSPRRSTCRPRCPSTPRSSTPATSPRCWNWCWTTTARSRRTGTTRCSRSPASPAGGTDGHRTARQPRDPGAGRLRRLRGDLEGAQHAAHAADVGHERHPRHRAARRPDRARAPGEPVRGGRDHPGRRDRVRHDQRRRRLPRDRPDARHVQDQAAGAGRGQDRVEREGPLLMDALVAILYIIAFALFIYGLMGLTGPKTAVRGNWIAAVGMAIAVGATLLQVEHNWLLIIIGLVVGAALGVPSARQVKMTAMPQMVALFNGVGGGAVALIAWSEFRTSEGFSG